MQFIFHMYFIVFNVILNNSMIRKKTVVNINKIYFIVYGILHVLTISEIQVNY